MEKLFDVGKLYNCSEHHLLVYSSYKAVITADDYTDSTSLAVDGIVVRNDTSIFQALEEAEIIEEQWWFKEPTKVTVHSAKQPMMVIETKQYNNQTFAKIISGNKIGWIMARKWLVFNKLC